MSETVRTPAAERAASPELARVSVRLTRDNDLPAMEKLFLECFDGEWPPFQIDCSVLEHIEWKLNSDPKTRGEQIVATPEGDDDDVICAAIRIRRPGWMRGESRVLMDAADMSVRPDWRMIRLSRYLRAARADLDQPDDFDVLLQWLPNHPATRKNTIDEPMLGNRVLVLCQPGSLRSMVAGSRGVGGWPQVRRTLGQAARARLPRSGRGRVPHFGGQIVDLEGFDDRTDAVWDEAKTGFDFAVQRTHDYLNWRYADPRSGRFDIRAAVDGHELVGYCVTKTQAEPAEVVDLLVRPGRLDAVGALVSDAVTRIRNHGDADIHLWLPTVHPYQATIRALGFYDSGRDPSLHYSTAVMTSEELAFLRDPALAVHITQGDSDFT